MRGREEFQMFSNKSVNSKVLAVAFVSMLMICSLGMMFTDESDAAYDKTFDIYMREDDSFSYTPAVNLSNTTITPSGTAMSNGLSDQSGTITGIFDNPGSSQLVLTANWSGNGLTQTAKQTINFHVYDRITFSGQENYGDISVNQFYTINELTIGKEIYTAAFATNSNSETPAATWGQATFQNPEGVTTNLFTFDFGTGKVTVAREITSADVGQYTVILPASYSGNGVTDSAEITLNINVAKDLSITSDADMYTFVGDNKTNTYQITSNYDGQKTVTYTTSVDEAYQALISHSGTTITVNTSSAAGLIAEGKESMTFIVQITATGDVDGDSQDEATTFDLDVTIYSELAFTTPPNMDNVEAQSATGNPLDVLATANFEGATKITYNWGDGTSTTVNVTPDSGSKFSARHVYSNAGTYAIVITAENDHGNTKAYMLYDATNGAWAEGDETTVPEDGDKTFFEEHGILFLIFAVLAIIMFLLFFFGFLAPYTLIAGIVLVIAAVVCFIGADFGLTEGLMEDLNI